jgi:hypothetical protein
VPDSALAALPEPPTDANTWVLTDEQLARLPEAPWRDGLVAEVLQAREREPAAIAEAATAQASGTPNLALNQPAAVSSGSHPEAAVDGVTNGDGAQAPAAQADPGPNAWWQVDLGESRRIGTVQLWPRTDACCLDRLQDVMVLVSDDDLRAVEPQAAIRRTDIFRYFVIGRASAPTTIPVHRSGRYVRIQLVNPAYLDIAEVQVWGEPGR